ncbi:MAG: hypothetical protein HXN43_02610 [Prevotella micans]|nr:hypothetical protein [Prevotella micans]
MVPFTGVALPLHRLPVIHRSYGAPISRWHAGLQVTEVFHRPYSSMGTLKIGRLGGTITIKLKNGHVI